MKVLVFLRLGFGQSLCAIYGVNVASDSIQTTLKAADGDEMKLDMMTVSMPDIEFFNASHVLVDTNLLRAHPYSLYKRAYIPPPFNALIFIIFFTLNFHEL